MAATVPVPRAIRPHSIAYPSIFRRLLTKVINGYQSDGVDTQWIVRLMRCAERSRLFPRVLLGDCQEGDFLIGADDLVGAERAADEFPIRFLGELDGGMQVAAPDAGRFRAGGREEEVRIGVDGSAFEDDAVLLAFGLLHRHVAEVFGGCFADRVGVDGVHEAFAGVAFDPDTSILHSCTAVYVEFLESADWMESGDGGAQIHDWYSDRGP